MLREIRIRFNYNDGHPARLPGPRKDELNRISTGRPCAWATVRTSLVNLGAENVNNLFARNRNSCGYTDGGGSGSSDSSGCIVLARGNRANDSSSVRRATCHRFRLPPGCNGSANIARSVVMEKEQPTERMRNRTHSWNFNARFSHAHWINSFADTDILAAISVYGRAYVTSRFWQRLIIAPWVIERRTSLQKWFEK